MSARIDNVSSSGSSTGRALKLASSLQIQDVEQEYQRLKQVFDATSAAAIDVSDLLTIDTAGVQLLLAIKREGGRCGTPIEYRGESPALTQALKDLGLDGALDEKKSA